jgi:hypothetical protein
MMYKSIEEFVNLNNSKPCSLVSRNYNIYKARAEGLTLQQLAIKFGLTRQAIINILSKSSKH